MSEKNKRILVVCCTCIAMLVLASLFLYLSYKKELFAMNHVMAQASDGPWELKKARFVIMKGSDGKSHPFWVFRYQNASNETSLPMFVGMQKRTRDGNILPETDVKPIWGTVP